MKKLITNGKFTVSKNHVILELNHHNLFPKAMIVHTLFTAIFHEIDIFEAR